MNSTGCVDTTTCRICFWIEVFEVRTSISLSGNMNQLYSNIPNFKIMLKLSVSCIFLIVLSSGVFLLHHRCVQSFSFASLFSPKSISLPGNINQLYSKNSMTPNIKIMLKLSVNCIFLIVLSGGVFLLHHRCVQSFFFCLALFA